MTGKVAPIEWNESLVTGVSVIDEQHKILVNMINEANQRLDQKTRHDVLLEIVRDLISYALYHFDEEEELMLARNYSVEQRERHIEEHRAFSQRVVTIQQELQQGKFIQRDELIGYLNNWLTNHIMGTDRLFTKL